MNGTPRDPDAGHRLGRDDEFRHWLIRGLPIALVFIVEGIVTDPHPLRFAAFATGFCFTLVAAIFTGRYFQQRVLVKVPTRFSESPSRPIRVVTKVAKGYAIYFVGFWTVIAIVGLFTIVNHFV